MIPMSCVWRTSIPTLRLPAAILEATRAAIGEDESNSWLPFTGCDDLKEAVAAYIARRGGPRYDGRREIVITGGEGEDAVEWFKRGMEVAFGA